MFLKNAANNSDYYSHRKRNFNCSLPGNYMKTECYCG